MGIRTTWLCWSTVIPPPGADVSRRPHPPGSEPRRAAGMAGGGRAGFRQGPGGAGRRRRGRHQLDRTRPPRRPGRHHHPARQRGRQPVAGDHHRHRLVETRAGGGPVAPGPGNRDHASLHGGRPSSPTRRAPRSGWRRGSANEHAVAGRHRTTRRRRVVLHAVGEIDASNAGVFAEALSAAAVSSDAVTVDLSAVQYLDSAAINVLVSHGGPLHIVANPMLIPVLRISGVAELATVRAARGRDLAVRSAPRWSAPAAGRSPAGTSCGSRRPASPRRRSCRAGPRCHHRDAGVVEPVGERYQPQRHVLVVDAVHAGEIDRRHPSIRVRYRDGCMVARCRHSASKSSRVAPGTPAARAATSASESGSGAGGRPRCR